MKSYVLDACALIAFFNGENGADTVENILLGHDLRLMSVINVYEVCYDAAKAGGMDNGIRIYNEIHQLPIKIIKTIGKELLKEAMYFKTNYKISLADSFALGLARLNHAVLISADHHEFDIIETSGELKFHWIR
ncbi:PIN domain-containing protein [Desulfonema limicola]|uniref:PIN domain-containing protein n=1 Tax=Desulfonema limicola TaxID=45656 RepID=A0A975GGA9_9BACT|nr:PIN domain-containing protein [Desulfonema limicola]QTA80130.1 PIN domain-containing protein [Desulfonema limicola]